MLEIWKDVKGYEGLYMASNLGNVKSLKREDSKALKKWSRSYKYCGSRYKVNLSKNGSYNRSFNVSQVVAMAFLDHSPNGTKGLVVDHIDNDQTNDRLDNLQLISNRLNSSKDKTGGSSRYVGVSWATREQRWRSQIRIEGKNVQIGIFPTELEAHHAYQKALSELI